MKEKVSVHGEEQELHINYCPTETGKNCEIYTTIPSMMRLLERMVTDYPDEVRLVKDDRYSYTVSLPFKLVKPRNPRAPMPEEKKALLRERLNAIRPR